MLESKRLVQFNAGNNKMSQYAFKTEPFSIARSVLSVTF